MLNKFCKWWGVTNTLPPEANIIALVSFGATKDRMTYGLQKVVNLGLGLTQRYPTGKVVFGEFTENPSVGLERRLKKQKFPNSFFVGNVISTIEEAEKWFFHLYHLRPTHIVIITDEMHSRSAHRVSNRVWNGIWYKRSWKWVTGRPMVTIHMATFPTKLAIDPESPMTALRSQWLWVCNNVLRELFLMCIPFGYTIMKKLKIHQPVAH